jgi:3-oxoacyl-[acyl-carrier-protein] synthase II
LLGAAGGVEAIATVKAILENQIHPTINLDNPEPDLEFDVLSKAQHFVVKKAISNSFGFRGIMLLSFWFLIKPKN